MAKILMIGDSPILSSGFARVNKMLAEGFVRAGHNLEFVGWCHSKDIEYNKDEFPYTIHPTNPQADYWGQTVLPIVLDDFKPDILFSLSDIWMDGWIKDLPQRKTVKWVQYFPLDGAPIPPKWIPIMEDIDKLIVFSKFGKKLVQETLPHKEVDFIYHGVDTKVFYPKDVSAIKKANNLDNKFIVQIVARNQPRKNIPAGIRSFAKFAQNKPDAALYLHMSKQDVGWDIDDLAVRFGLQNRVWVTEGVTPSFGVSDQILNDIYNLADVFLLPTMGEGFGLPILEAQACGVPVIATDYSACSELIPYKEGRAKVQAFVTNSGSIDHAVVDESDIIHKLNMFYRDRNLLKRCSRQGYEFASQMTWDKYIKQFVELISEIEKGGF